MYNIFIKFERSNITHRVEVNCFLYWYGIHFKVQEGSIFMYYVKCGNRFKSLLHFVSKKYKVKVLNTNTFYRKRSVLMSKTIDSLCLSFRKGMTLLQNVRTLSMMRTPSSSLCYILSSISNIFEEYKRI